MRSFICAAITAAAASASYQYHHGQGEHYGSYMGLLGSPHPETPHDPYTHAFSYPVEYYEDAQQQASNEISDDDIELKPYNDTVHTTISHATTGWSPFLHEVHHSTIVHHHLAKHYAGDRMPVHKDFEEHHYIRDDPVITQATVVTAEPKPVVHKQDTKVHEDVKHEGDAHHVPSDWNIDVDTYDIAIPSVVEHVDHYPVTVHHETPIHHEIFDEDPLYNEDFPHEKLVVHQAPVVHSTVIHQTEVHHVDDDPHATHDSYDTTPIPPEVLKHYTHAQKQEEPKAATPAEPKAKDTDKKEIKKEEEPKELRFEDKHSVPDAWQVDVQPVPEEPKDPETVYIDSEKTPYEYKHPEEQPHHTVYYPTPDYYHEQAYIWDDRVEQELARRYQDHATAIYAGEVPHDSNDENDYENWPEWDDDQVFSLHDAEIFIDGGFDDDLYRGGLPPLGYYGGEFYGQNESAEDDMFFNENEAAEENFYKDTQERYFAEAQQKMQQQYAELQEHLDDRTRHGFYHDDDIIYDHGIAVHPEYFEHRLHEYEPHVQVPKRELDEYHFLQ